MPLNPLPEPAGRSERISGFMKGLVVSAFLFSTLLAFNFLQTASLVIKLFSQRAFRRANRSLANLWWTWCALIAEKGYRIRFAMSGDNVPERENAIVVLNHQDMADITVTFTLARSKKRIGDLKWFVKDVLKYVPGVGWGMLFLDCLFVKRNWTDDREYILRVFQNILKYRVPVWIMIFAEGTRVRPDKLEKSRRFAEENGFRPLRHLLLPRTKGFVATMQALPEHTDAVYDVTIGYVRGVPSLWQWIKGYVREVHVHVRRFPMRDIPRGEEEIASWLVKRFEEKDDLLDVYYRTGAFPKDQPAAS
jgi:1-acyl-sn-glycerol-3-phosphate acyltransferase